jgi:hypothetical protein
MYASIECIFYDLSVLFDTCGAGGYRTTWWVKVVVPCRFPYA